MDIGVCVASHIKDIKYVRSHAQAIGQCQNIINKKKSLFKVRRFSLERGQ